MNYPRQRKLAFGSPLTPMVKYLVIACVGVYLLQVAAGNEIITIFGLTPYSVFRNLFIWQPVTYLFLHGSFWHIFFNLFALWMFGSELERYLGSRRFLHFFLVTGVGAGLLSAVLDPFSQIPTIGASGSIYGILMAYGMLFPNRLVYLYFLFPVKVKYFVAFLGVMAFFSAWSSPGSTVAHMAHLGGMVFAFLYLKGWLSLSRIRSTYQRWKMQRLRRRFQVHEGRKKDRDDDFWIN